MVLFALTPTFWHQVDIVFASITIWYRSIQPQQKPQYGRGIIHAVSYKCYPNLYVCFYKDLRLLQAIKDNFCAQNQPNGISYSLAIKVDVFIFRLQLTDDRQCMTKKCIRKSELICGPPPIVHTHRRTLQHIFAQRYTHVISLK